MRRLPCHLALLTVLTLPQPAYANGSMGLLVYAITLPGAVLFSYLAAMGAARIKPSLLAAMFPSTHVEPEVEMLDRLSRQEWVASSIAYALALGPGGEILREFMDARYTDPLVLPTLALYFAIYIPVVYWANKSFGSVVAKDAWGRFSRGKVVAYTLVLSLVTSGFFIVMCGMFVGAILLAAR